MPEDSLLDSLWAQSEEQLEQPVSVAEARQRVKAEPKAFKAAVTEGAPPLMDAQGRTILFKLVKTATEYMKQRVNALEGQGYRKIRHGVSHGVVVLEGPAGEQIALAIDKARRSATL